MEECILQWDMTGEDAYIERSWMSRCVPLRPEQPTVLYNEDSSSTILVLSCLGRRCLCAVYLRTVLSDSEPRLVWSYPVDIIKIVVTHVNADGPWRVLPVETQLLGLDTEHPGVSYKLLGPPVTILEAAALHAFTLADTSTMASLFLHYGMAQPLLQKDQVQCLCDAFKDEWHWTLLDVMRILDKIVPKNSKRRR